MDLIYIRQGLYQLREKKLINYYLGEFRKLLWCMIILLLLLYFLIMMEVWGLIQKLELHKLMF